MSSASLCHIAIGRCWPRHLKSHTDSDLKWMTSVCFVTANSCHCEKPCRIWEGIVTPVKRHHIITNSSELQIVVVLKCDLRFERIYCIGITKQCLCSIVLDVSSLVLLSRVFDWRIHLWVVFRFFHAVEEIFGVWLQWSGPLSLGHSLKRLFQKCFNKNL